MTSNNESYLRPLFCDFAADKKVWDMTDEFMFGRSILAAPILDPQYTQEQIIREDAMTGWDKKNVKMENGEQMVDWSASKEVTKYLPKGVLWYDFWTGKAYQGGQTLTLQTSLEHVPMFVRAGSILPLGPDMQYTERNNGTILRFYSILRQMVTLLFMRMKVTRIITSMVYTRPYPSIGMTALGH